MLLRFQLTFCTMGPPSVPCHGWAWRKATSQLRLHACGSVQQSRLGVHQSISCRAGTGLSELELNAILHNCCRLFQYKQVEPQCTIFQTFKNKSAVVKTGLVELWVVCDCWLDSIALLLWRTEQQETAMTVSVTYSCCTYTFQE